MSTHRELTRKPTTPGEILHEEFLKPLGMSQKELADHLGCDVKVVNRIVNGRTSVTAEMALKLGASFQTSPACWARGRDSPGPFRYWSRRPDGWIGPWRPR